MHIIVSLATEPDAVLRLTYADGKTVRQDLGGLLDTGGVYAALRDPRVFVRAVIGEGGRYVEWLNGVDLCADALRMSAQEALARAV